MNELTIRAMRTEDLDAASRLAAMLVRQHHAFDADRFMLLEPVEQGYRWFLASQLDQADALLLIAEVGGVTAGYLYGAIEARNWALLLDRHGAIHDVYVDPGFRRRGVARALLTQAFARLDPQVPRIVLSSATANHDAQRLFASLGFRSTMVEMTRTPGQPGLGDSIASLPR